MSRHAQYIFVTRLDQGPHEDVVIRDVGPWDQHLSVTNDAEHVVKQLFQARQISNVCRLFYYDSNGELDELVHKDGTFLHFSPIKE